jgi:uncharacterized protein DUF4398
MHRVCGARWAALGGALLGMWVAGCGGAPPPIEQLASTQAAIRGAEEVGAKDEPKAALHLKLAQDQLVKAKALLDDDENEEAAEVLQRAELDAELAHSLAKEQTTREEADDAKKALDKLKGGK